MSENGRGNKLHSVQLTNQGQKIGKPNNLNLCEQENKGPKQDCEKSAKYLLYLSADSLSLIDNSYILGETGKSYYHF